MPNNTVKAMLLVWLSTLFIVLTLLFIAVIYTHNHPIIEPSSRFEINRLNKISDAGLVVIGTSLVGQAFFYDEDMDRLSQSQGAPIQFIRFSKWAGKINDFEPLLNPILLAKPKWVFIQIGPFISIDSEDTEPNKFTLIVHRFYKEIFLRHQPPKLTSQYAWQSDAHIKLNKVATFPYDIGNTQFIKNPTLPPPYIAFIQAAQNAGIQVVFLQIKRSIDARSLRSTASLQAEEDAIKALSIKYHLKVWQSPAFALKFYTDGGHLNNDGRKLFTAWFLQRFKNEFLD